MKSTFTTTVVQEKPFPCLKEYITNHPSEKIIVFFTDLKKGIVVFSENTSHKLGEYSELWISSCFKPFHGTVNLSTE